MPQSGISPRPITILVADDDADDRMLTRNALAESRLVNDLRFVEDGEELMEYLYRRGRYSDPASAPRPGLILLDLNMPRMDGREALREIKGDPHLRHIPIVVLTTSKAEEDIYRTYGLGVNSFITKPVAFEGLVSVMRGLGRYWFDIVELPPVAPMRADDLLSRSLVSFCAATSNVGVTFVTESVPVRVLLVEDDEDDVVLARQSLRDIDPAGFVVDWAPEFDDALKRLADPDRYDVCLVDYHLGAHDGVDFVRRARDKGCAVPIILLTGLGDRSVDVAAMNAGAADFLNKNQLTSAVLERSIRYAIQHCRAEEQRIGLLKEQAARREAEAANQAKDQFLAVLSHELRTPLSAVLLTLSALEEEGGASPAMREMVEVIKRNVDLEARLIDDLLDLTRIARGKLEIRREIVDLHRQIEFAVKTCCGADIEQKRLTVTVHTDAPIHHVWGDPARLQQVLWNLIKNAAKFTPEGGRIEVRTSNANGHGGTAKRLRVEVSDTGIGIPAEALPKIFKAFEQADRNITRQFGGLGLGLAICKALVDLHGGRIAAHSDGAGRGATFSVDLPALAAAELKPRGTGDLSETAVPPSLGGRSVSILLVEDHADTARAMSLLLRRRGYAVRAANSLADALRVAESAPFDIVISDIGLPDGSGLDLMRALRDRGPITGIALSGYGMEVDLERSRAAGFTEHLTKPVDFRQLENVIARLVRRDNAQTPTTAPAGHT